MVATAAAAGMSGTLVLGHAVNYTAANLDVALSATVIGVGGRDDPTSTRLKDKLDGNYALGFDTTNYVPIDYPANLQFQTSIDDGVPKLAQAVGGGTGTIRVVAYSEGTLVAEQVKRDLAPPVPGDPKLDFVLIASPYVPNGGLFGRLPGFRIPGLLPEFSAAQPSPYDSTYVTNEYDGFADFPAYFNPLSIANAVLGMAYAHPDQYYDGIDLATATKYTYEKDNTAGGHDTYVLVYNPHLPLLAPLRQIASLLALAPLTEPVLGAIEPLLRVMVDMGYTDRTNAHPDTPTAFSFLTPPAKLIEAINAVPGALVQGAATLPSGGQPSLPISPGVTQVSPTPQGTADADRMQIASDPQGVEPQHLGDQQDPQAGSGDLDPTEPTEPAEPYETSSAPTSPTGSPAPPTTNPAPSSQVRLPKLRMPTPADFLRPHVTTGGSLFVPGSPAPTTTGTTTGGTPMTTVGPTTTTTTSGSGSETTDSAPGNSPGDGQAAA